jgi:hypothetical protein
MTPSLASWTKGVFVKTFEPGIAGIAHDATGLGERSTSTKHIRQLPAIASRSW